MSDTQTLELAGFSRQGEFDEFLQRVRECGHVRRRRDADGFLVELRADGSPAPEGREDLRASLREKLKQRLA
jgi:hypothetical protein